MSVHEEILTDVFARARNRCEYCHAQKKIILYLEIDHVIPLRAGGTDDLDNLCAACRRCNGVKLAEQTVIDPTTGQRMPLFNPRRNTWGEHFRWSKDSTYLIGLTSTGRATIAWLKMNDAEIIDPRLLWVAAGWHPPADDDQ
jgi:hypothetical protein